MNLVTPLEAANAVFVTREMITYWVKKGRVQRHPIEGTRRNYLVDLDEVKVAGKWKQNLLASNPDLLTPTEAGVLIGRTAKTISQYVQDGHIRPHYVLGNGKHYLVDRNEVLAQPKRIHEYMTSEERRANLRRYAKLQPRNGRLFAKSE
jgi:predicted site-specific integrase-resolvase